MAVNTVTQYLGLNVVDGTTPQAKRIRGVGTVVNLGPTFGSLDSGFSVNQQPINRVVFFNGSMFAIVGSTVYRSTDGANSWSSVYSIPSINSSTSFKSGLNVVTVNMTVYLCFIYYDTSTLARGAKSIDGVNWAVDSGFTSTSGTQSPLFGDTVWASKLWCLCGRIDTSSSLLSYNPGAGQLERYTLASTIRSSWAGLGVFNDSLYLVSTNTSTGERLIYSVVGGAVIPILSLGVFSGTPGSSQKLSLLVDSPYLYAFNLKNNGSTWGCWQIDASNNVVDVTSSVIPAGMTGSSAAGANSRTLTFVDTDWAPGTNPPKYLIHANDGNSGTAMSLYAWQGPSSPMVLLDAGGNVAQAFSISKFPTASGFFIVGPAQAVIQMIAQDTSGIGLRISFIIQGPAGIPAQSVRLWYGTNTEEYLQRLGALSDPSAGSLNSAGTALTGLTADGLTSYSFTWTPNSTILGTNGVGTRYKFALEAFQ